MEALVYEIKTALEVLPVSRDTLYKLIGSGEISTITIGRRRFITRAELERFVSDREQRAAQQHTESNDRVSAMAEISPTEGQGRS